MPLNAPAITNLTPLILFILGKLDTAQTLVLYWMETFILCLFSVPKILFSRAGENSYWAEAVYITAIFIIISGIGLVLSGFFIFTVILPVFGADQKLYLFLGESSLKNKLLPMLKPFLLPLVVIVFRYAWSLVKDYILGRKYRIFDPYYYAQESAAYIILLYLIVLCGSITCAITFSMPRVQAYVITAMVMAKTVFESLIPCRHAIGLFDNILQGSGRGNKNPAL